MSLKERMRTKTRNRNQRPRTPAADAEATMDWTGFASESEDDGPLDQASPAPPPSAVPASGMQIIVHTATHPDTILGRYVPPHLRDKTASAHETETLAKLSRQLKGSTQPVKETLHHLM